MITKDTIVWNFFSFCYVHAVISVNRASSLLENRAHAKLFTTMACSEQQLRQTGTRDELTKDSGTAMADG